jgi:hypothetical protein
LLLRPLGSYARLRTVLVLPHVRERRQASWLPFPDPRAPQELRDYRNPGAQVQQRLNTDFYVAAATVIPVLYVALTVQGTMVSGLLDRINHTLDKVGKLSSDSRNRQLRLLAAVILAQGAIVLIGIILLAGVPGEMIALLALLRNSDTVLMRNAVLCSIAVLLVVTALGPVWALNTAWVRLQWIPVRKAWSAVIRNRRSVRTDETSLYEDTGQDEDPRNAT